MQILKLNTGHMGRWVFGDVPRPFGYIVKTSSGAYFEGRLLTVGTADFRLRTILKTAMEDTNEHSNNRPWGLPG